MIYLDCPCNETYLLSHGSSHVDGSDHNWIIQLLERRNSEIVDGLNFTHRFQRRLCTFQLFLHILLSDKGKILLLEVCTNRT